jgi:hypothetical protein
MIGNTLFVKWYEQFADYFVEQVGHYPEDFELGPYDFQSCFHDGMDYREAFDWIIVHDDKVRMAWDTDPMTNEYE